MNISSRRETITNWLTQWSILKRIKHDMKRSTGSVLPTLISMKPCMPPVLIKSGISTPMLDGLLKMSVGSLRLRNTNAWYFSHRV